jgi:hypothetical protein
MAGGAVQAEEPMTAQGEAPARVDWIGTVRVPGWIASFPFILAQIPHGGAGV